MLGAIIGDIVGSVYEWHNIKTKDFPLFRSDCFFTDDTVMTCAVAEGIMDALEELPDDWMLSGGERARKTVSEKIVRSLKKYGRAFPHAGYGGSFYRWLQSEDSRPYNSWGNGSAMRASFAGWAAKSLEEAELLGELSAAVTHNHPEGIKGAKAVAGCIYTLRAGGSKEDVRQYAEGYYDLSFTLDEIRADYRFDVSCQGSVPQAIAAFLTGEDFADVVSEAISIGGDSDTIAAIAGSIAEVIYPIPAELLDRVAARLAPELRKVIERANIFIKARDNGPF
jgi:ADP-ribosylglycohydrolase